MSTVAVLVPGIMGTELYAGPLRVWPGPALTLLLPYPYMTELSSEDLEVGDVLRNVLILDIYGALLEDLERCLPQQLGGPHRVYTCPYDWRKDNRIAAEVLAITLDGILTEQGNGVEIVLVGHSMGGLVSRYYLESGVFDARPAFGHVRSLLTIGTPHRGAASSLRMALGREKQLFLSKDQVRTIVNDPRYPSLYQLLPPRGEPFVWSGDGNARYQPIDIYDVPVAEKLGLSRPNLNNAQAFHASLDTAKRPAGVRYFFFTGTQLPTATSIRLVDNGAQYADTRIDVDNGGDGTVPFWSASLPGIQGQPVAGEHSSLFRNRDLRRIMATLLGAPGALAPPPSQVDVAIRDRVIEPEGLIHVSLIFSDFPAQLEGELRVEWLREEAGAPVVTQMARYPVRYTGGGVESLGLRIPAPAAPRAYRLAYYPAGSVAPAGIGQIIVQASQ